MASEKRNQRNILVVLSISLLLAGLILMLQSIRGYKHSTVIVEWSTASELDTAGFNLYRSETKEGPFEKINVELIPASADPLTGSSYKFEDKNATAGNKYFYQLEDIEYSGATQMFGPIEVKASGSGLIEVLLASALTLIGIASFVMSIRQKTKTIILEAADVS